MNLFTPSLQVLSKIYFSLISNHSQFLTSSSIFQRPDTEQCSLYHFFRVLFEQGLLSQILLTSTQKLTTYHSPTGKRARISLSTES